MRLGKSRENSAGGHSPSVCCYLCSPSTWMQNAGCWVQDAAWQIQLQMAEALIAQKPKTLNRVDIWLKIGNGKWWYGV
uniref:HDC06494 n=1 Tax=Drosophila melanogaster TaxID=7227 RepID=Q6IGE9_DROME|nr:TPA_inf: HDC06494 [Drosophila melanogaster]